MNQRTGLNMFASGFCSFGAVHSSIDGDFLSMALMIFISALNLYICFKK